VICLTFATVHAPKDGYESMFVVDAVGGRSQTAHRKAIERLSHAGAVPSTALAVLCELFRDWTSPPADKAREVISWYFAEVPKLTAEVGVTQAIRKRLHHHRYGRQHGPSSQESSATPYQYK